MSLTSRFPFPQRFLWKVAWAFSFGKTHESTQKHSPLCFCFVSIRVDSWFSLRALCGLRGKKLPGKTNSWRDCQARSATKIRDANISSGETNWWRASGSQFRVFRGFNSLSTQHPAHHGSRQRSSSTSSNNLVAGQPQRGSSLLLFWPREVSALRIVLQLSTHMCFGTKQTTDTRIHTRKTTETHTERS